MKTHWYFLLVWVTRIALGIVLLMLASLVYVVWEESRPLEQRTKLSDKTLRGDAEQVFNKNDVCKRWQYEDEPELKLHDKYDYRGEYKFHPKLEHSQKCPILVIYLDPYNGSFAGVQKIYPNISP